MFLIKLRWHKTKSLYKNVLSYPNYLQKKDENSIVEQALKLSIDLHCEGQNSFYFRVGWGKDLKVRHSGAKQPSVRSNN